MGIINVYLTQNNTFITVTNFRKKIVASGSAGSNGFKGPNKRTPYAAQVTAFRIGKKIKSLGINNAMVIYKGISRNKYAVHKGLIAADMYMPILRNITPVAHNGCKVKKLRN